MSGSKAGFMSARLNDDVASVDLYWIPLGAGGHFVHFNGLVYEAVRAAIQHRPRCEQDGRGDRDGGLHAIY